LFQQLIICSAEEIETLPSFVAWKTQITDLSLPHHHLSAVDLQEKPSATQKEVTGLQPKLGKLLKCITVIVNYMHIRFPDRGQLLTVRYTGRLSSYLIGLQGYQVLAFMFDVSYCFINSSLKD
jgi:hypothetical protein